MNKRFKLQDFRRRKGLTQKEIAEMLEISSIHYSRIECGDNNPSWKVIEKLAKVFELTHQEVYSLLEKC